MQFSLRLNINRKYKKIILSELRNNLEVLNPRILICEQKKKKLYSIVVVANVSFIGTLLASWKPTPGCLINQNSYQRHQCTSICQRITSAFMATRETSVYLDAINTWKKAASLLKALLVRKRSICRKKLQSTKQSLSREREREKSGNSVVGSCFAYRQGASAQLQFRTLPLLVAYLRSWQSTNRLRSGGEPQRQHSFRNYHI